MSWSLVLGLAALIYAQKAIGPLLAGAWSPPRRARIALHLLAVPVLAGLIVVQTLGDGRELVLDARAPAVLVAIVAVWRGAPFLVVVLLAAVVAAFLRFAA
jgi:branched-subunit amino acid transport protein